MALHVGVQLYLCHTSHSYFSAMGLRMLSRLLVLLVVVVALYGGTRAQVIVNACDATKNLTFLQVGPLTGTYGPFGSQYTMGLQAAFGEYNRGKSSCKPGLNLLVKNDKNIPYVAQAAVTTTLNTTDVFAVVGVYSTQSALASYQVAVDNKVPFVGARTGDMTLRQPFQRYVVNFRVSFYDEAAAMVEHLVAQDLRCIVVFWQDDEVGEAAFDGVQAALSSSSHEVCAHGRYTPLGNAALIQEEISELLDTMVASAIFPDAIVLAAMDGAAATFILQARALWPNVFMGGLSWTNADLLVTSLLNQTDPTILKKVLFTQLTPLLTDTSIPLVTKYKNALAVINASAIPSATGIEGYLVGRLVIAALDRTFGNYSREAFLNGIYDTGFFNLDGLRCGPFLPENGDGGCNQCMHQVQFVKPLSNGTLVYEDTDSTLRFSTCGYKPYEWTPLVFAQSCSYVGARGQTCRDLRNGINAAFKEVNDGGGVRGSMKLQLITKDDLDDEDKALQNNIEFLNDPTVFGLIGTAGHSIDNVMAHAIAKNKPMFGAYSGLAAIREPFHRSIINFRAHHGDEVSAIVHHFYYNFKIRKISILYENSTMGLDVKQELQEHLSGKRLSVHSEGTYERDNPDLTEAIYSIFFGPNGLPEAIVVVGFADFLGDVLLEAHSLDRNMYVFALSQTVTVQLVGILSSSDASEYLRTVDLRKLMFTQTVPVATDMTIPAVLNYTSALAKLSQLLPVSASGLEGYLVGQLVATSIQRVMGSTISTKTVVDAVYDSGSFNLFGTRCGPLLDETNTSEGCNQCMKRVWLTGVSNDGQSYYLVDDSFSFTTCLYESSPNFDFQLDGMRMLMVIVTSGANAYVILVMIGMVVFRKCHGIRENLKFSFISCVGALLSISGVYVMYFIPNDLTCAMEPWVADMSFVLLFGPLFSKTSRIDKLFNNKKMQRRRITDKQVLLLFLQLLLGFVFELIVWEAASGRRVTESLTPDGHRFETCESPIQAFQYISWFLKALVLVWGCFLCSRVYKISGQFARLNESKEIAVSIYNTTFSALVALILGVTLTNPNQYFLCFSVLLIINTSLVVSVVFAKPLLAVIRGETLGDSESDEGTNSSGTGPESLGTKASSSKLVGFSSRHIGSSSKLVRTNSVVMAGEPRRPSHMTTVIVRKKSLV